VTPPPPPVASPPPPPALSILDIANRAALAGAQLFNAAPGGH
jgi:hypothetical protein